MTIAHEPDAFDGLLDEAGIIGNALLVGDHDDAQEWAVGLVRRAEERGQAAVAAAADRLAADLGPVGSGPAHGFGPALAELSDAFDQAADR